MAKVFTVMINGEVRRQNEFIYSKKDVKSKALQNTLNYKAISTFLGFFLLSNKTTKEKPRLYLNILLYHRNNFNKSSQATGCLTNEFSRKTTRQDRHHLL